MDEGKVKEIFAENIMYLRKSRNLYQSEFGKLVGAATSTVSEWENANKLPRAGMIEKLSAEFKIPKSALFEPNGVEKSRLMQATADGFVKELELSDKAVIDKYNLVVDGAALTEEQIKKFLAYVRIERSGN